MRPNVRALIMVCGFVGICSAQQSLSAQTDLPALRPPDPKSVEIPNMAYAPTQRDKSDFDSNYYFFKAGVTYEQAFEDLDVCKTYGLSTQIIALVPKVVPLGGNFPVESSTPRGAIIVYVPTGVLAAGIGTVVANLIFRPIVKQVEDDMVNEAVKRCMAYKGYDRYGTSSDIYNQINAGTDVESTARRALIASGPRPPMEAIDP